MFIRLARGRSLTLFTSPGRLPEGGFASIYDVDEVPVRHEDRMETFWIVRLNSSLLLAPTPSIRPCSRPTRRAPLILPLVRRAKPSSTSTCCSARTVSSRWTSTFLTPRRTYFPSSLRRSSTEQEEGREGGRAEINESCNEQHILHTCVHSISEQLWRFRSFLGSCTSAASCLSFCPAENVENDNGSALLLYEPVALPFHRSVRADA